jgi:hypothetical protein
LFFVLYYLQFEADKFVDGLLGIGAAGGKSSSSEAAMLTSRLETLRKERAARSPEIKFQKKEPVAARAGVNPIASTNDFGAAVGLTRKAGSKRSNRRRKGKR